MPWMPGGFSEKKWASASGLRARPLSSSAAPARRPAMRERLAHVSRLVTGCTGANLVQADGK